MIYNFEWNEIEDAKWIFVVSTCVNNKLQIMEEIAKHISIDKPKVLKLNVHFYDPRENQSYGQQRIKWICEYLQMWTNFSDTVVIEEIDSLIDAPLQRNLPAYMLEQCGIPVKRLIVSISNPLILLGAPKESVIIHIEKNDDTDELEAAIFNIDNVSILNPNILYTSPLFGVDNIISDTLIDFSKLRTEDSWKEMEKNDELDRKLLTMYHKRIKE